jgi:two-component system, OmpR family, sensor kinase
VLLARIDSIERRLLLILLLASVGISLLLALSTAWIVRQKVGDLLDYQLEQTARTLLVQGDDAARVVGDDPTLHLEAQMWDASGRKLWRTGDDLNLPANTALGLSSVPAGRDESAARVYTVRDARRTVQVAIDSSTRDELAISEGLEMLWPSLLSLVALSFAIVLTVRHGLRPLRALDAELARRSAQSLAPVPLDDAPQELRRPLATLNDLLSRLDESLQTHRRFVADAAHELRTPLAAIRLQASNVFTAHDDAGREAARVQLMRGIERAQRLVQQLLTLARFEPGGAELAREQVDLHAVAQDSLVDLSAVADDKGIELSLGGIPAAWVQGDKEALRILIDNVVGNAIKYAPGGTSVTVELVREDGGLLALHVRDQGPGIAPQARQRVFDRFHRQGLTNASAQPQTPDEPGSGLGLAIVADIVRAHGAQILLDSASAQGGLDVQIRFVVEPARV